MNKKPVMWSVSLLTISIVTLILAFSNIFGIELPNVLKILLGIIDLVVLPILVYTSVKAKKTEK